MKTAIVPVIAGLAVGCGIEQERFAFRDGEADPETASAAPGASCEYPLGDPGSRQVDGRPQRGTHPQLRDAADSVGGP